MQKSKSSRDVQVPLPTRLQGQAAGQPPPEGRREMLRVELALCSGSEAMNSSHSPELLQTWVITCSEVRLILGLAPHWIISRGISRRPRMVPPVWTGSKAVVSALQCHLHSDTLSSLITHLASYFCQSCTTTSQGEKAVVVPALNHTLELYASMTWKKTLLCCQVYVGGLQALRPGFHPLPN